MSALAKLSIGEIVASHPSAAKLFDNLGVDYACHGSLTLHDACAEAALDPVYVKRALDALPRGVDETNWFERPVEALLTELRDHKHTELHARLAELATLIAAHASSTSPDARAVDLLRRSFANLCEALQPHMTREEHMLFPVIQHLEDCWTRGTHLSMNFLGGITKPLVALVSDHNVIVERLRELEVVADGIDDRSAVCRTLADRVRDLAHEIREHIHLENNILYPRATALEAALRAVGDEVVMT